MQEYHENKINQSYSELDNIIHGHAQRKHEILLKKLWKKCPLIAQVNLIEQKNSYLVLMSNKHCQQRLLIIGCQKIYAYCMCLETEQVFTVTGVSDRQCTMPYNS